MQQGLPVGDVFDASMAVTLDGQAIDPVAVSIEREYADHLPGGGALTAASGSVAYVPGDDVASTVSTPWDPTPGLPGPEAPVSVSMDMGAGPVSLLPKGRVIEVAGSMSDRDVEVGFTDLYRSLDRPIAWEPMAARMPAEGDAAYWRNPGLFGVSIVDRIFRHCGWYATPPMDPGALVSAPMQGSAWAEAGKVTRAERLSIPNAAPGWITSPWGMLATDLNLTYTPARSRSISQGAFEITAMLPPDSGTARIVCWMGDRRIQLVWTDASVYVTAETGPNTFTQLVSMSRSAIPGALAVTARITRRSDGVLWGAMRSSTGVRETGTDTPIANSVLTTPLSLVTVYGSGRCGGFQVAQSTAWLADGWSPSAVIHARAGVPNRLQALPPVVGESCAKLLEELAVAEYATYWIDELGVLHWWDLDRLNARGSVATLTTADHVTSLEWAHSLSSVYSRVNIQWAEPAVEASFSNRVEFWRGGGGSLTVGAGELIEEIITSPPEEVWLMPDLAPSELHATGSMDDYNMGIGSWFGGVYDSTDTWSTGAHVVMAPIGPGAFKITTTTSSSGTPRTMVQKTASLSATTSIWPARRSENLPILRGKLKYTLFDATATSTQAGPAGAPELTIDVGRWIQYATEAQNLADRIGAVATAPTPELSNVGIVPAPGLQLGDKITLSDPQISRLTYQGVIYADSRSLSQGDGTIHANHTIRFRPTAVSRNGGVTWTEWASMTQPKTRAEWAASEGGTWAEWGSNPLNS